MKQIFIYAMLMIVTSSSFCQQIDSSKRVACEEYLTKSINQRTAARVLLIGGGALIIIPVIIAIPGTVSFSDMGALVVVAGIGVAASLASIPLFAASAKNKRKSMDPTFCFKIDKSLFVQQAGLYTHYYPALSLRLHL